MISAPATLVGLAGVVFLAGSFVPTSFSLASLERSHGMLGRATLDSGAIPVKGDRVTQPLPSESQARVSTVEIVGLSQATVILRDRNGEILYRSDPQSGVTAFSKNTNLPIITLREEMRGPVVQHPETRREGTEMPQDQKPKRRTPVGCIGDVSPLAKAAPERTPSLCLAFADQSLS